MNLSGQVRIDLFRNIAAREDELFWFQIKCFSALDNREHTLYVYIGISHLPSILET